MDKYSIGIDFGSTSGKLVLVNIDTGEEVCSLVVDYKHGNIASLFHLPLTSVIHHPQDYLDVIYIGIPNLISTSSIPPYKIISLGIDSTTSTVLPTDVNGTPMCFLNKYKTHPNAYVKLWKDHSAQHEATIFNTILEKANLRKMSAEWLLPKAAYVLNNDPELYYDMDKFIEIGDWLVWRLTGTEKRSSSQASFTSVWSPDQGFVEPSILKQVDKRLENFTNEKLTQNWYPPTKSAGFILKEEAQKLGLTSSVTVAIACIDAIATFPALGVTSPGKLISVIGTSACHMLLSDISKDIPESTKVKDAIIPGFYTYISSQIAVGDCFDWFFKNIVPYRYYLQAESSCQNIYDFFEKSLLSTKHNNSCIALDWWNGTRKNSHLNGLIWGLNINTKPEDIYLALIESTAFGLRNIIDRFEQNGISINEIYVAGGVSHNSPAILQIYSNITKRTIKISRSKNASALGAAIFSAVATGKKNGGYDDIATASAKMGGTQDKCYYPQDANSFDQKFTLYRKLCDYFQDLDPL